MQKRSNEDRAGARLWTVLPRDLKLCDKSSPNSLTICPRAECFVHVSMWPTKAKQLRLSDSFLWLGDSFSTTMLTVCPRAEFSARVLVDYERPRRLDLMIACKTWIKMSPLMYMISYHKRRNPKYYNCYVIAKFYYVLPIFLRCHRCFRSCHIKATNLEDALHALLYLALIADAVQFLTRSCSK